MCENIYIGVWSFSGILSGFSLWHTFHVVRHGHFILKQLRLHVLNEMHTNSCTGPRLSAPAYNTLLVSDTFLIGKSRITRSSFYNFNCVLLIILIGNHDGRLLCNLLPESYCTNLQNLSRSTVCDNLTTLTAPN